MGEDREQRRTAVGELIVRTLAAIGLGASALLLWEYLGGAGFCGRGGGCDAVRLSEYAKILGIHTPVFGVAGFGAVLLLALVPRLWARRLLLFATAVGAVGAIGFILLQAFVVHAYCQYCMIVDTAGPLMFIATLTVRNVVPPPLTANGRSLAATAAMVVLGAGGPFAYGFATKGVPAGNASTEVPPSVLEEQQPGVVTIVEFADFQCPYCRAQHRALALMLDDLGDNVRVIRKHVPLPAHQQALGAARAAICAEEMGRGDLMAEQLFEAEDLAPQSLYALAERLGLDMSLFEACMNAASTDKRLSDDEHDAVEAKVQALPTFFIGLERFEGLQKDEKVHAALTRAIEALAPTKAAAQAPR